MREGEKSPNGNLNHICDHPEVTHTYMCRKCVRSLWTVHGLDSGSQRGDKSGAPKVQETGGSYPTSYEDISKAIKDLKSIASGINRINA